MHVCGHVCTLVGARGTVRCAGCRCTELPACLPRSPPASCPAGPGPKHPPQPRVGFAGLTSWAPHTPAVTSPGSHRPGREPGLAGRGRERAGTPGGGRGLRAGGAGPPPRGPRGRSGRGAGVVGRGFESGAGLEGRGRVLRIGGGALLLGGGARWQGSPPRRRRGRGQQ